MIGDIVLRARRSALLARNHLGRRAGRVACAVGVTAAAIGLWSAHSVAAASVPAPWVQLTSPCADDTRFLGAGTQAWWAQCGASPDLKRSTDEGKTWQDVPLPGFTNFEAAEVRADGSLFLAMQTQEGYPTGGRLVKVNPTTGAVSGWDLSIKPAAVTFDRNGGVWVAWCSYPDPNFEVQVTGIHMARIGNSGTVSDEASMAVADSSCSLAMDTDREGSLYLTRSTKEVPNGPSKRILTHFAPSGTQLVGRSAPVVYDKEGLVVTVEGAPGWMPVLHSGRPPRVGATDSLSFPATGSPEIRCFRNCNPAA